MLTGNSTTPSSNLKALRDIGFSFDRNGVLTVDDAKLSKALENNFDEVVTLFGGNALTTDSNKGIAGDAIKSWTICWRPPGLLKDRPLQLRAIRHDTNLI